MAISTPGATHLQLQVDGMTCQGCRDKIGAQVAQVAGVTHVDVDLETALVSVSGEELAEQVVRDAILFAGYHVRPA